MAKDGTIKAYSIEVLEVDKSIINDLIYKIAVEIVVELIKISALDLENKTKNEIKIMIAEIINRIFVINFSFTEYKYKDRISDVVDIISKELSNMILELPLLHIDFSIPIRYVISDVKYENGKIKISCRLLDIKEKKLKEISIVKKEYIVNTKDESFKLKKVTKKLNK